MSATAPGAPGAPPRGTATGLGRVLVALYAVFAVAAVSRASVQIATRFAEAPLAYALSAFAGVVYVVATLGLARTGRRWRRTAWAACTVELLGVLAVGTLSLADAAAFPDDTVWSAYGRGYLFIPLVLPVLGLVYLRAESRRPARP
ncbi:hypothetical protein MO973_16775 [Paenibacillus sp. TRM 82003]|uniref:hypothetical protein n=1 Tax=Kineococcus sp. TRM81007 TaxID=2925831 RepID=UPI001F5AA9CD|nr:hypothetical protein [Kineococcus sp. TRM81007]MCI2236894.1 hypothetical protein [Kineococcus sp. TRM81007]MCI3921886.1 hypothetical protein [Paenibacillus sp. TRM 82003]